MRSGIVDSYSHFAMLARVGSSMAGIVFVAASLPAFGVPPLPTNNLRIGELCLSLVDVDNNPVAEYTTTTEIKKDATQELSFASGTFGRVQILIKRSTSKSCTANGLEVDNFEMHHLGDRLEANGCLTTDDQNLYLEVSVTEWLSELRPKGQAQPRGIAAIQYCSISNTPAHFGRQILFRYRGD